MSRIDIVIVNWNGGQQIHRCLASLAQLLGLVDVGKVVVVDNASTDGSVDDFDALPFSVHLIRNQTNRGFGAACNQGARICESPFLLFLNPDTEVEVSSLAVPLRVMNSAEGSEIGVCSIQLQDAAGEVARSCARFPTPAILFGQALGLPQIAPTYFPSTHLSDWAHDSTRDVDHVIGAFYLIRRALFIDIGGFDERFFVYLEDLDLSKAVIARGKRIVYLASAQAFHRGGGTSEQVKAHRLFYSRRSRIQYAFKHFSRGAAIVVTAVTMCCEPWLLIARGLFHRSLKEVNETMHGYGMLWADMPNFLRPNRANPAFQEQDHVDSELAKAA